MINKDGDLIWEGQWCNGRLSGFGRQIWDDEYFVGDFKNSKYHGIGTLVSDDGFTYVGAWKDGYRHGKGK